MSSPNPETDSSSMFMQKGDGRNTRSPTKCESSSRKNSLVKASIPAEVITVKDFFDFMKTAYQVYEHLEGDEDEGSKINWEELTKLTVINHVIGQQERDLLQQTAFTGQKTITSQSDTVIERKNSDTERTDKRYSCSEIEGLGRRRSLPPEARVEMLGVWTEANLNCKLNDVINEGILDSILPYLVGYKKPSKTTSVYAPIIKKSPSSSSTEIKKPASFGGFVNEKESWDRLGRRKSSVTAAQDRVNQKQEGDVEIHVCDEVKGLKKDFRCPQKLLISKMGYFADVTAGQRLEDMDISVHCDIQIFDWLMRWVKRDTILVADWPLLDPQNVVPILVSASFLQMEPLLHDCLIYCHAHMNDIVKTSTNLACLSDALLTRLAAMYTNAELEAIRDRKDKIQSRLYCKMIMSLAEPVPETLRGHYATLATLFKCSKCNKLLGRHIAGQVPCQPSSMRIDRRGNVISEHTKDPSWSLNEYIRWLYGELRSWRRVYWRLWADCHFLHCQLCDSYFPAYQMEWCSHHEQSPQMFAVQGAPLAAGRYACCGERAYRFETLTRNTGCQFREHVPEERLPADAAVMEIYTQFRDIIAMRPPQLMFPERLTRLVPREGSVSGARLQCSEVYWWQGVQLVPPRAPLGLLGRLYTSEQQFNPLVRPGSPPVGAVRSSAQSLAGNATGACPSPDQREVKKPKEDSPRSKQGVGSGSLEACESSDSSEQSDDSDRSDEDAPRRSRTRNRTAPPARNTVPRRGRAPGRVWVSTQSARSNQDGQRRFEERAASHMRAALVRRHHHTSRTRPHPGGVYARLEAEWRERQGCVTTTRTRQAAASRARPANKYK
ncbi:SANT and BTB domain regulator of class switch recombination isoform X1 [Danaus plexippus]|uniref:SANT and BTB domain regulator of class switch recombination isoform X1 n=2 Tax=Danaus plexippus TaxID=13037 RepID=UPI0013C4854C|nr:SANT and BTB domain regulator of class switch recombination isoform X1 [Danaus plexippus]